MHAFGHSTPMTIHPPRQPGRQPASHDDVARHVCNSLAAGVIGAPVSWCAEVALWAFGTGLPLAAADIPVRCPSDPRGDTNRTQRSHYVNRQAGARRVSSLQCLEWRVAVDCAVGRPQELDGWVGQRPAHSVDKLDSSAHVRSCRNPWSELLQEERSPVPVWHASGLREYRVWEHVVHCHASAAAA